MTDRYQTLVRTPIGQVLAKNLGLPNPTPLKRYEPDAPLVDGTVDPEAYNREARYDDRGYRRG